MFGPSSSCCSRSRRSPRTRSSWPRRGSTPGSRAATTTRTASPGARRGSLAYGKDTPYGRIAEYATVAAITRDDLAGLAQGLRRAQQHRDGGLGRLRLGEDAGAAAAGVRLVAEGPAAPKAVEAAFPGPKPGVYFVAKDDVNQSKIQLVHLGTRRDTPDYYALEVMNEVFGGGFASRLFSNVRSKKGLAYSVYGGVGMRVRLPGPLHGRPRHQEREDREGHRRPATRRSTTCRRRRPPPTSWRWPRTRSSTPSCSASTRRTRCSHEKVLRHLHGYPPDSPGALPGRHREGDGGRRAPRGEEVRRQGQARRAGRRQGERLRQAARLARPRPVTTIDITIPTGQPAPKP